MDLLLDLPQKASYQWRYLSILIYPWSSPLLVNVGLWSYTQQSSPRTKDHRASPQTIIHPSTLYQPGFSAPMRWKHTPYMEHHLPRELALSQVNSSSPCWDQDTSMKNPEHTACLTELIHGSHRDITGAHHLRSAFRGFIHLANFGAWLWYHL